ncbi:MAG: MFS transporter [Cyclobacteriaceae bacterium]|nr:MFS transporter [Cyclobacteriaceae bacterium]
MQTGLQKIGNYRWRICALLFFATTINYVDRNVLSFTMIDDGFRHEMLDVPIDEALSQADQDYFKEMMGYIDAAFKMAYAIGFLIFGYVIDRIGTKKGFSLSISVWSIAGILNAFVGSFKGLGFTRFMLGLGESGNFPSSIKTVAEWFPKKERSFAVGIFNAGANVGIIITALAVPWITLQYGWRAAFIVTGLLGVILLFFWRRLYSQPQGHPRVNKAELAHIESDQDEQQSVEKVSWRKVITYKQTWAFAMGKFLTDPIWWFYLTWLPDFFNSNEALDQKLDLKNIGIPFIIIYLISDLGSVFFGWLASKFIQIGWTVNRARKTTMFICALCVVPIVFASTTHNLYLAIALIALATAAHAGWSANIFTTTSDMFPKQAVGSVVGIGGMVGATGGALFAAAAGLIRVQFGYLPLFIMAGCAYLLALLIIHLIVPNLEQVKFKN